ncbi:hypothetical protein Btru_040659 [Bulinus truncatus]|nr:hypothetical protein Btru_040659 [Bulinus truncatus]
MDVTKTQDSVHIGPYKATRLWNDVIGAFRQFVPCGRHRRYMKTFDNCFSGGSATDWLHQYLKNSNNFNEEVSREKALSLLNKLYKAGIFEEVKISKTMRHKADVQENRLYKFLPASPSKMKIYRLPLAPRNDSGMNRPPLKDQPLNKPDKHVSSKVAGDAIDQKVPSRLSRKISILKKDKSVKDEEENKKEAEKIPPCHLVSRVLTTKEIKDTWKTIFVHRLKNLFSVSKLTGIISEEDIDGYNIMHNCVYLNKSGIVTNIDAKEQLPHWVMSAMKCLARWPEPPEPGLPNYPGFEKDVYGVVRDYFLGLNEPLIPYRLYDIFINVFVMSGNSQPRHSSPHHNDQDDGNVRSSLWTTASLENIILNLTKKYCLLDSTGHQNDTDGNFGLSQHYGTQEDLRFISHVDKSYFSYNDRKLYNSTDGMDKCGPKNSHHFSETDTFHPVTSFKSCHALSKTTHSAGDARSSFNHNKIKIRKYDSTPNLKVSRYETAFGPDNRTVTRIFYQNGMTTDYGHDEDEDLYHLPLGSTRSKDKLSSKDLERSPKSLLCSKNGLLSSFKDLPRSKSQYDVTSCAQYVAENLTTSSLKHNDNSVLTDNHQQSNLMVHIDNFSYKKCLSQQSLNDKELCADSSSPNRISACLNKSSTQLSRTPSLIEAYGPGYRPSTNSSEGRRISSPAWRTKRPTSLIELNKTPERKFGLQSSQMENPPVEHVCDLSVNEDHYGSKTPKLQSPKSCADLHTPDLHLSYITPFCSTNAIQNKEQTFMHFPRNRLSEDRAKNSLQIVSLLIPPSNRRKLHLLFKMMTKMTSNPNLCLDYTQTTQSLVLSTFHHGIIRSQEDCDLDNLVALQLVSFMLDFYDDIFTPPSELKAQVSNRLKIMQRPQVIYSPPPPDRTVRFCQQTSVADYENQRISASQTALEQLLEEIISDNTMEMKDKKKRLKQFQKMYPSIYTKRFPTPESEAAFLESKYKKSSKLRTINRLKGVSKQSQRINFKKKFNQKMIFNNLTFKKINISFTKKCHLVINQLSQVTTKSIWIIII